MRYRPAATAAALLLALGACGDDGGGDGSSSEREFQDQADDLCKRAAGENPVDLDRLIRDIDALVPPESMQDDVSELLTQYRDYQDAVDRGEDPPPPTVRKAGDLADELGLPECAEVLDA